MCWLYQLLVVIISRRKKLLLIFSFPLAGLLTAFLLFSTSGINKWSERSTYLLQDGDLVLRRGRSAESFAVYLFDKNRDYSHIGIVVLKNGKPNIIHATPDGNACVQMENPSEFLSPDKASHALILRPNISTDLKKKAGQTALSYYRQKLKFDNHYDLATDNELYCTELILKAFGNNKIIFGNIKPQSIRVLTGVYSIVMPGSFSENSNFTRIKAW